MDRCGLRPDYVVVVDGKVVESDEGRCPEKPDIRGVALCNVVNGHTHCVDYELRVPGGMSLEELVAPSDDPKQRHLREAPEGEIAGNMRKFSVDSRGSGAKAFANFREGSGTGCKLLRTNALNAFILGRPTSPEFDPNEINDILDMVDSIGISNVSNMDHEYIEATADAVRSRRKAFAMHVSERVREDIYLVLSLDPAFMMHMCESTDGDIAKCAEAEVPIVVCPKSNAYFGKVPPIAKAQRLEADLAISTNNGMIRSPNILTEAAVFMDVAECQGGNHFGALGALTDLAEKVLNRAGEIQEPFGTGGLTIVPQAGTDLAGSIRGHHGAVRVD